jgi:outer membrane biosynthesis protein TonB
MSQSTFGSDIFDGDEPAAESASSVEEAQDTHNIQEISLHTKAQKTPDADALGVSFQREEEPVAAATPKPTPKPQAKFVPEPKAEAKPEPKAEARPEPEPEPEPKAVPAPEKAGKDGADGARRSS